MTTPPNPRYINREMNVAVQRDDLHKIEVNGTTMDYHGATVPSVAALRELAYRHAGVAATEQPFPGEGVLIGLVDGAFAAHPWLEGGYLASPNEFESFFPGNFAGSAQPKALDSPFQGHSTFVAGLILQQAPAAGVWVEKALKVDGAAFADKVREAAVTLARRNVDILNLSLGCFAEEPEFGQQMQEMVDELHDIRPGLVIVASAGNKDEKEKSREFWPAALDDVEAVGSVIGDCKKCLTKSADWSNTGGWVDFAANGNQVLSTYLERTIGHGADAKKFDGWATWSGTSFSTAIVSGAIAREMTVNGQISAREAVEQMKNSDLKTADGSIVVQRQIWDKDLYFPNNPPNCAGC